ncbi:MAG TPA: LysR family transcriptional regulator [Gemmatimonadales bacterium]|nr:LysR family transcriptional regulator [Gemmatimonadales bacterium]
MELRHLRYFVAVAEERGFLPAARRLRVAQPALSKQIHDLEAEIGCVLFERHPRGTRLTAAGEAFLGDARVTLERAAGAIASARRVAESQAGSLRLAHGDLYNYASAIGNLLTIVRSSSPEVQLHVVGQSDATTAAALRTGGVDMGCVFLTQWPLEGFEGCRLLDTTATGVLLAGTHPLAAQPTVRLSQLESLPWLGTTPGCWPGVSETLRTAFRERGLVPRQWPPRAIASPSVQIVAGDGWALTSAAVGASLESVATGVVYRPFADPPIPAWLALVWVPPASAIVQSVVHAAQRLCLTVPDDELARPCDDRRSSRIGLNPSASSVRRAAAS